MVGSGANGGEGKRVIDATVGGLVWVRRGNGSWWPGQIVGFDESPEDGSGCTRSGTRIKLLDRDDSSVESHDLEKTKVVKAFRCGDYDSCIEKAKASATAILRRSLNRPKRERAIVYALEIEKASLCNNSERHPKQAEGSATTSRPTRDSNGAPEETSSKRSSSFCEDNSYSTQELSHSGISYEESNGFMCKRKALKGKKRKTPYDSDDDGSEGVKRMKGLNDLGVGAVNKIEMLSMANTVSQTNTLLSNFHDANCLALGSVSNGSSVPTMKRKRSQVVQIHEILKKKYRCRPLTKILENTSMVPVRIICDEFATPFERSDAMSPSYECGNCNKLKVSELVKEQFCVDDPLYALFDVPFLDEDLHSSGYSPIWKTSSPSKPNIDSSEGGPRQNVQLHASSSEHEVLNESCSVYSVNQKVEESASKWQGKGKRNVKQVTTTEQTYPGKNETDIDFDNSDMYSMGLDNLTRLSPISNGLLNGLTNPVSMAASPRSFSYQPRFFVQSSLDIPDVPSVYEVDISVEATRPQAPQVPYISLLSKLSGKPIIGHPITVELLRDDVTGFGAEWDDDVTGFDVTIKPTPPRPAKHILLGPHLSRKKSSRSKKKKQKNKHRRGSCSKKTRKLSSLTEPDKLNPEMKKSIVSNSNGPPTMAYVPLKVVFSRINEALNSLKRSATNSI